jgi:hypothetical protein
MASSNHVGPCTAGANRTDVAGEIAGHTTLQRVRKVMDMTY